MTIALFFYRFESVVNAFADFGIFLDIYGVSGNIENDEFNFITVFYVREFAVDEADQEVLEGMGLIKAEPGHDERGFETGGGAGHFRHRDNFGGLGEVNPFKVVRPASGTGYARRIINLTALLAPGGGPASLL